MSLPTAMALLLLCGRVELSSAGDIEPKGKALAAILGATKGVMRKEIPGSNTKAEVFFVKNSAGQVTKMAFVEHAIYEPNCSHTWAIGLDANSGAVTEIRPIEMGCPHAYPTKAASFLDQFKGKGPADAAKLDTQVQTVAKATGTSKLLTDAVKRTLVNYGKIKGQL